MTFSPSLHIQKFLFSREFLRLRETLEKWAREILQNEMGLPFSRTRLTYEGITYPLQFVVFDHDKILGQFDPRFYSLGINKAFAFTHYERKENEENLKNLIRHELAHLYVYLKFMHKNDIIVETPHGPTFRETVKKFGWDSEVLLATGEHPLQKLLAEPSFSSTLSGTAQNSQRKMEQIQKLLALGDQSNAFETQEALRMAQKLLSKYYQMDLEEYKKHFQSFSPGETSTDFISDQLEMWRVLYFPKANSKLDCICQILREFFVSPVYSYSQYKEQKGVFLELTGRKHHLELATHIALFLDRELDKIWNHEKKVNPLLKGIQAKNSFMRGMAKGFLEERHPKPSQNSDIKETISSQAKDLVSTKGVRKESQHILRLQTDIVYSSLRSTSSKSSSLNKEAWEQGKKRGRSLSLFTPLSSGDSSGHSSGRLLSFLKN